MHNSCNSSDYSVNFCLKIFQRRLRHLHSIAVRNLYCPHDQDVNLNKLQVYFTLHKDEKDKCMYLFLFNCLQKKPFTLRVQYYKRIYQFVLPCSLLILLLRECFIYLLPSAFYTSEKIIGSLVSEAFYCWIKI